jgi:hypothetical protein
MAGPVLLKAEISGRFLAGRRRLFKGSLTDCLVIFSQYRLNHHKIPIDSPLFFSYKVSSDRANNQKYFGFLLELDKSSFLRQRGPFPSKVAYPCNRFPKMKYR